MIVYLDRERLFSDNNIYKNHRKIIVRQKEFVNIGNFFKNVGSSIKTGFNNVKEKFTTKTPTPTVPPSTVSNSAHKVSDRASRIAGNKSINGVDSSKVTPVVPDVTANKQNFLDTNVKVNANADIQAQSQQYLNSKQVQNAQNNSSSIQQSANKGNKKFDKQQTLLNNADYANQVLDAGGNTYVMGAKNLDEVKSAVKNSNDLINNNQFQGQVANKPAIQQNTQTPEDIKQTKIIEDKLNRQQESENAQRALKERLVQARENGSLQQFQQSRQQTTPATNNNQSWWDKNGNKVGMGIGMLGTGAAMYGIHKLNQEDDPTTPSAGY